MMRALLRDFWLAGRTLRRSPGYAAIAMLTLALGIGANLGLFGILNEMLLRPKPVARPGELWEVVPAEEYGHQIGALVYRPYYDAIVREGRLFEEVIGYASIAPKIRTLEGSERIEAELVAGDYFSFLGVVPALGRSFLPEEVGTMGPHAVAVISHAFWMSRFGGAGDVLGQTVTLNDIPIEIVGVAPAAFGGLDHFWQPCLWMPANMESVVEKHSANYAIVGRLGEPRLARAAEEHLTPIAAEVTRRLLASEFSDWPLHGITPTFTRVRLEAIGRGLLGTSRMRPKIIRFLQFATVATVLLLLIACANVAGLFLARAMQYRRETATRVALGATRWALMRQVMCEGMLVAAGGALGALLAFSWVSRAIMTFAGWWPGAPLHPVFDARVVLFALGSVLIVGIGSSLLPALQATRFEPFAALKDGGGAGRRRLWLRHGLIVTQVVGSLVLLCGAMLCLRSMSRQLAVDLGYRHERLAVAPLDLERIGLTEGTSESKLEKITRRVAMVPGVEQVGVSCYRPLVSGIGVMDSASFVPEGYRGDNVNFAYYRGIGPGMFKLMGIPLLRGREFTRQDMEPGRDYAIVNERFARRFWPDQDPLGKHVYKWEVIGVIQDASLHVHDPWLDAGLFRVAKKGDLLHPALLIRTQGNARRVVAAVRNELGRIHPRLINGDVRALRDILRDDLAFQQAAMRILAILGGLALLLASVGIYGVMAYVVSSRTREIGIRVAVGATRGDVMRLVLSMGLRLGLIALLVGLPLALGGAVVFRHAISGVSPFDPVSFAAVAVCTLIVMIAACWFPARRAARTDPMEALRCE